MLKCYSSMPAFSFVLRQLNRGLNTASRRFQETWIADVPGVTSLYRGFHGVTSFLLERSTPDDEVWIDYETANLCVDPSDYVGGKLYREGVYEPAVRDAIYEVLEAGETAFDVGAHTGHHGAAMRNAVGDDGRVVLFEPHPRTLKLVRRTIDRNGWQNVELIEKAVADVESTHSLVEDPENTGGASLSTDSQGFEVKTCKMGNVIRDLDGDNVSLLKMDIEGGETAVVRELGEGLTNVEHMILEVHNDILSSNEAHELWDVLTDYGTVEKLSGETVCDPEQFQRLPTTEPVLWERS